MRTLEDEERALRSFVAALPSVASARELERLLCEHIGVDPAFVRGRDEWARPLGGLCVDPGHLAQFLWGLRGSDARTFLHVGTYHGHSFIAMSEFLRCFVGPHVDVRTIDEHNYALTDTLPYVLPHRMFRPTRDLAGRQYDIVFIESGNPDDYRNVGQHARVCAWHAPGRGCVELSPLHEVRTTYGAIVVLAQKSRGGI